MDGRLQAAFNASYGSWHSERSSHWSRVHDKLMTSFGLGTGTIAPDPFFFCRLPRPLDAPGTLGMHPTQGINQDIERVCKVIYIDLRNIG